MPEPMEPTAGESRVEQLVEDYFLKLETGEVSSADEHLAQLDSDQERREFRTYLELGDEVTREFPYHTQAGTVLADRYELLEELGAGGMGEVWSARDRNLDREVAVKILNSAATDKIETKEFMEREREALARLNHPGIVTIHDAHIEGEPSFLVMNRITGRSLEDILDELRERCPGGPGGGRTPTTGDLEEAIGRATGPGRAPLVDSRSYFRTVARITAEILRTLEAAHGSDIVHRDIKPANIMFTGGGHPVLLDFGLAAVRAERSGALTGRLFGTVNYVAPEQIKRKEAGKDVRTDVYQVGLVLYAMLTLEDAYDPDSGTTLNDIEAGRTRPAREVHAPVPEELERICATAMASAPGERYGSARAFREDLERFLRGKELPVACESSGVGLKVKYFVRRRWPVLLVAAALLLAFLPTVAFGSGAKSGAIGMRVVPGGFEAAAHIARTGPVVFYVVHDGRLIPLRSQLLGSASAPVVQIPSVEAGDRKFLLKPPESLVVAAAMLEGISEVQCMTSPEKGRILKVAHTMSDAEDWIQEDGLGRGVPAATAEKIVKTRSMPSRGPSEVPLEIYNSLNVEQILGEQSTEGTGVERFSIKIQR